MAKLTAARQAVWNAILNYAPLLDSNGNSVFRQQLRFEAEMPFMAGFDVDSIEASLGFGDLPAITITWGIIQTEWNRNTDQEWTFPANILFWTRDHSYTDPESYAESIIEAVHAQNSPETTVPYVKAATGHHPKNGHSIGFFSTYFGEEDDAAPVTRTELLTTLRVWKSL